MGELKSFEDLKCWIACRKVVQYTRMITRKIPKEDQWDLARNMKRAARSTTRNIAEGYGRHHHKENLQFCRISRGSLYELLDDFITCKENEFISIEEYQSIKEQIIEAIKILNGYIRYLKKLT